MELSIGRRLGRLHASKVSDLQAFTLVELLVALVISGIGLAAAGAVIVQHIKMVKNLELAQRQRDNATRLDYLVQIEVGEAQEIVVGESSALGSKCVNPPSDAVGELVCFVIPKDIGGYSSSFSNVYYYNYDGSVWRLGPRVNRNGTLRHSGGSISGIAIRDGSIDFAAACSDEMSNPGQFVYRLDYDSGYEAGCSIAYAKAVYIN